MKNSSVSTHSSLVGSIANSASSNSIIKYSFYGAESGNQHCIITSDKLDNRNKFKSPKTNLLLYTLCSNMTRIKMYTTFMQLLDKFTEARLIRVDADAMSISYPPYN